MEGPNVSPGTTLITGSSGYIGRHLIRALHERGHRNLVGIDRRDRTADLPEEVRSITADLATGDLASLDIDNVDTVFHLAAAKSDWGESAEDYHRDNNLATERLIEAAGSWGVKRWVNYSTVAVFGASEVALDESAPARPVGPYGTTKFECQKMFRKLHDKTGVPVLQILPSAVFGPENPENTNIFRLAEAIDNGRFVMIGDGANLKTTSYLHNLVAATLHLHEQQLSGNQEFIYVDDPAWSTEQLVTFIGGFIGKNATRVRIPLWAVEKPAGIFDWLARTTKVDLPITSDRIKKFCRATNYTSAKIHNAGFVQPYSMEEALEATLEWHVQRTR